MTFLPIRVYVIHEYTVENLIIEGVMTRDFGPWKTGQELVLTFNFDDGTCTKYDDKGDILEQVKLVLKADIMEKK